MNCGRYTSLAKNDILCGRGSGPNEHIGNVEFRKLVLTRKVEYNNANTSRATKGKIANDIINTARSKGGRFLRKLNVEQMKEAGCYKRGMAVYELADEVTILEKTKQTLRQNNPNKSVFAAAKEEVAEIYEVMMGALPESTPAVNEENQETSSGVVSWNPIPHAAAVGTELKDVSMKGMELTACIIKLLTKALSDKSLSNTTTSSLSASHATNFTDIDSTITSGSRASDRTMLSMTTAELYDMGKDMSFLDSTNGTTTSAHVISAILKEYEDTLYQEQSASNTHIHAINQSHMQNIPEGLPMAPSFAMQHRTSLDLPHHDMLPCTNDHVYPEHTLSQGSAMTVETLLRRMSSEDKQTLLSQFHQLQQHQIETKPPSVECHPMQSSHQMNQDTSVESKEENAHFLYPTNISSDKSMKSSISTVGPADCLNESLLNMSVNSTNLSIADNNFNTSARSMERSIDSNMPSVLSMLETPLDDS